MPTETIARRAPAAADPLIRIDRTRPMSTVHGDRTPDDPHYRVHFMQQGLPFDANGRLIPDDGKTEPFKGLVEGVVTTFHPLYTPAMRELVQKKLDRLKKGIPVQPEELDPELDPEGELQAASEDVNLESWLRGEAQYPAGLIFAACKKRFHKNHVTLRSVIDDLVNEEKIIPEADVATSLLRLLDSAPARV